MAARVADSDHDEQRDWKGEGRGTYAYPRCPEFLDLVSNTNTHAARTRTGAHEAIRSEAV
jgi:hypothetical protein